MRITLPKITWPTWTRNSNGENFYDMTSAGEWSGDMSNLKMAQDHPILTPALLFVSKLFSQAHFELKNVRSGNITNDGDMITLLNNPNLFQTREDFLETLMFVMIAQGVAVVALNRITGFNEPDSMFVLNYDLITWPENFNESAFKKNRSSIIEKSITYDKDGENVDYKIKDLMFFYDLPNALDKNPMKVKSRLDGLKQTLINTKDSLIAKNIILKSNGKELISGKKGEFPLTPDEKKDVESMFNSKLGLSFSRKRGVVTKADVTWKSMHIALRDLGLDESVKVDGNLIYTALHIPKDILSLEAKKTTYNNFKESMVSYIQNEMQSSLNSACSVFNKNLSTTKKLCGNFWHLQVMQFILLEKYEVALKQGTALQTLRNAGIPDELALEMCGLPKDTKLNPLVQVNNSNESDGESGEAKTQLQKVWGRKQQA